MSELLKRLYSISDNLEYFLLLGSVFLTMVLLCLGLYFAFFRKDPALKRLEKLREAPPDTSRPRKNALYREKEPTSPIDKALSFLYRVNQPSKEEDVKSVRLMLMQAGLRTNTAHRAYVAIRLACGLLLPLCFLLIGFYYRLSAQAILLGFAVGIAGYFLPTLVLKQLVALRKNQMNRALPDAIDLMVVCAESGLGLDMTLKKVGEEIRPLSRHLSDEFNLTNLEIQAGKPRIDCFQNMNLRTGVKEIGNLMTVISQSTRFGTSISKALRVHSDAMRTKRRQIAEEKANKTMVKMMFPLIFFILPALFIVIIGPAAIRISKVLIPIMKNSAM